MIQINISDDLDRTSQPSLIWAMIKAYVLFLILTALLGLAAIWVYAQHQGYAVDDHSDLLAIAAYELSSLVPEADQEISEFLVLISPFFAALLGLLYFLPMINAYNRGHPHRGWILVTNLIFGVNPVFWILVLIWSFIDPSKGKSILSRFVTAARGYERQWATAAERQLGPEARRQQTARPEQPARPGHTPTVQAARRGKTVQRRGE